VLAVRAELLRRCAALEPEGGPRVHWRRAHTLCAPGFEAARGRGAAEAAEAAGRPALGGEPAAPAGPAAQVEARRAQLQEELAWAEAALASRRALLRHSRDCAARDG
jgi:hypothetical protein